MFSHQKILDFFTFDAKSCVVGSKAEGLGSVYLLIYSEMGSSYLAFGQTAQECFNKHKHSAVVVSEQQQ